MKGENGLKDLLLIFSELAVGSLKKSRESKRVGLDRASQFRYGEYVAYIRVCNTLRRIIDVGKEGGETE